MPARVTFVTPNIVCIRRRSYFTCSYIVRSKAGVVLVDAGMDSSAGDVELGLEALDASLSEVKAVLLTHWHNDHAAGAAEVQARTGAPVYAHVGDWPFLKGETRHGGLRGWVSDRIPEHGVLVLLKGLLGESTPRPVDVMHSVDDDEIILDDFQAILTPGHTPGHVAFYYRPERALFAGDALAVIENRVRFMARPVTPDRVAARESLRRCVELRPSILCPGHREPATDDTEEACDVMLEYLDSGGPWPLLG